MTQAYEGATVNAAGSIIATARPFGTSPFDLSNPDYDHCTVILFGPTGMTIKNAISAGILRRNEAGILEELVAYQPATREDH